MSRARRQMIGAFLGAISFILLCRHYFPTSNTILPSQSPLSVIPTTQHEMPPGSDDQPHPQFLWKDAPTRYPVAEIQTLPVKPHHLPKIQSVDPKAFHLTPSNQKSRETVVKETFDRCWKSFQAIASAPDGPSPLNGIPENGHAGWSVKLLETLDTLWIMGMYEEFEKSVVAVAQIDFQTIFSPVINTHDVNVRLLGGMLAAFDLSSDERLLNKCIELGDMLYSAFDTPNRMPVIHWDSGKAARQEEQLAEESVLVAEVSSFILEFTRLSQITGDSKYYDAAQRVMEVFDRQQVSTKLPGLWPISANIRTEVFEGDEFTFGAESNSLYKSLPQAYALLGGQTSMYRGMYEKSTLTAAGHNLFRPMNPDEEDVLLSGTVRVMMTQNGKSRTHLQSQVHSQSCFAGGVFALGGALFKIPAHKKIAHKLVDGCIWAHRVMPQRIMPEVFDTVPCASQIHCPWNEWHWKQETWKKANSVQIDIHSDLDIDTFIKDHHLPKGFIAIPDAASKLRPEVIESMFILYRVTGREDLLDKAWELFQVLQNASLTDAGNAAIVDVTFEGKTPVLSDSIDSFWMSETLKYFYLMFSPSDLINLDEFVFNARGHPLMRPQGL